MAGPELGGATGDIEKASTRGDVVSADDGFRAAATAAVSVLAGDDVV